MLFLDSHPRGSDAAGIPVVKLDVCGVTYLRCQVIKRPTIGFSMNRRNGRVNFTLQRELGVLIDESISDPRLAPMTSVTRVECTADYSIAHVYISSLGDPEVRQGSLEALESASGFLRREIDKRIQIRHVPRLVFHLDNTLIEGANMLKMMDEVAQKDRKLPKNKFEPEGPPEGAKLGE